MGTVAAQSISMAMSIYFFLLSGKSSLKFKLRHFIPDWILIKEIIFIGVPSFLQISGGSFSIIISNRFLRELGGDLYISIYGIVSKINAFFLFPVMGLVQGIQPIIGFNKGAGKTERVYETVRYGSTIAAVYGVIAYIIIYIFAAPVFGIFADDKNVIEAGVYVLRITGAGILFAAIQNIQSAYFQSIGKKLISLFLALCNTVLCFLPIAFILSNFYGLQGLWYTFPLSGAAALIISSIFTRSQIQK